MLALFLLVPLARIAVLGLALALTRLVVPSHLIRSLLAATLVPRWRIAVIAPSRCRPTFGTTTGIRCWGH
jgi:hypothetical protein